MTKPFHLDSPFHLRFTLVKHLFLTEGRSGEEGEEMKEWKRKVAGGEKNPGFVGLLRYLGERKC